MTPSDKIFDLAVGWWVGGYQVENHATSWPKLQDCKISSRVEIPKLDPSVAILSDRIMSGDMSPEVLSMIIPFITMSLLSQIDFIP